MPGTIAVDTPAILRASARLSQAATSQSVAAGRPVDDNLYRDEPAGPAAVLSALHFARQRAEESVSAIAGLARTGEATERDLMLTAHEFDRAEQLCSLPR